jgi:hypothetical protein
VIRRRAFGLAVTVVAAYISGACTENDVCIVIAVPAIKIQVRDAVTDELIAGPIKGTVTDGSFRDSLVVLTDTENDPAAITTLGGAYERAGTYAVHLEVAGYQAWDTAGVHAFNEGCHVGAVSFTARLKQAEPQY